MVVSVWFGLILFILFTAGIIDEWKRTSHTRMSDEEKAKCIRSDIRRLQKENREMIREIKSSWKEHKELMRELRNR